MSHHAGSGSSRKGLDVDNILPRSPLDICSILCHCGRQYIFLHLHRAHSCPDIAVHARGPHGTARAPAAPTAERGAGRASSRSPPPPPPPPGQIHMGRGSRQRSPHSFLPSSGFCLSRPRASSPSSGFTASAPYTPSPPFLGRRLSRRAKFG